MVSCGGEGAAGFWLRYHIDDLAERHCLPLYDDGAVQMFAALRREENAGFLCGFVYSREDGLCYLKIGVAADSVSAHFAGRTPDHKDLSLA